MNSEQSHVHRSGKLKQKNKKHRTKFSSKSELKRKAKGRIVTEENINATEKKSLKHSAKAGLSKLEKKNKALQIQKAKRQKVIHSRRFGTSDGPPKIICTIALGKSADLTLVHSAISNQSVQNKQVFEPKTLILPDFKQRVTLFGTKRDNISVLDAAKVADIVICVIPVEEGIDEEGEVFVSLLKSQGLPSVLVVLQGLNDVKMSNAKKSQELKKIFTKWSKEEFPESWQPRVVPLDSENDAKMLRRWIHEQKVMPIYWRDARPYMLIENYKFIPNQKNNSDALQIKGFQPLREESDQNHGTLIVQGYLRGKAISANQLVHLVNYGTYQLNNISSADDPCPLNKSSSRNEMVEEYENQILDVPDEKQETLQSEIEPDMMSGEQTWPTEDDFGKESENKKKIKVPKGFSSYQAAWIDYDDDDDDDGGDGGDDDNEEGDIEGDEDGDSDAAMDMEVGDHEEYVEEKHYVEDSMSETIPQRGDKMFNIEEDENMTEEERIEARNEYLKRLKESRDEMEFPDEMDIPYDVSAKQRLQKYRGLKSFKDSPWDSKENLPLDYARIYQFENFQKTQKIVMQEPRGGVEPESYISFSIKNVPEKLIKNHAENGDLLILFGLLKHEQKMSVMHLQIRKSSSCTEPVKSKDELYVQCGFRLFKCNPLFSQHNPRLDKHKYERFLPSDGAVIASTFAPITFKPSPAIIFKRKSDGQFAVVATGTVTGAEPDRIILKRVILTGYPFKIYQRHCVVRFMFFNPEDVRWFKPVELHTKKGRVGVIKEPIGTHGMMKCAFDDRLTHSDTVMMNLYKRVFPKWTTDFVSKLNE